MHTHNQPSTPVYGETDTREELNHVLQTGILNELLREQLTPAPQQAKSISAKAEKQPEVENDLLACASHAVTGCLGEQAFERAELHQRLSGLFHLQKSIYDQCDIAPSLRNRQFITHSGLVLSPEHCVTTVLDVLRVRSFWRGIDEAIAQKVAGQQRPVHIVYPACGPFAPLLLPLIGYYKAKGLYCAKQLQITLIDIQIGAVQSLEAIINQMGIKDYIQQICTMDALAYDPGEREVDIVVLEAMQHGLSREGQIIIARHFATLLQQDGFFIPEQIEVSAVLNRAQREFVDQWRDADTLSEGHMSDDIKSERIELGTILTVDKESLLNTPERVLDENTRLLECGLVDIPPLLDNDEQTLLLCTRIRVFGDEVIGEYDSGVTHPLPDQQVCINFTPKEARAGDLLVNSGDGLRFYYRMNGLPGFLATWAVGSRQDE